MKKEELYEILDWLEEDDTQTRISDAIVSIIYNLTCSVDDADFRDRISKAIALIVDDIEEWRKEW